MNNKGKNTLALLILSAIAGLVYLAPFLRFSFYDQMMEALQLTDVQMGTLGSVYGLFYVIVFVPSGILAEKFNTKRLLLITTIGMCLSTVWYSFYPGYTALLIIHALYGIFSVGTFWSPYLKAIRSLASEEKQGTIFGLSEGLRGVAQTIVSFICLGALGAISSVTFGFRVTLWINAAAFVLLALAVFFLLPDFDQEQEDAETSSDHSGEQSQKEAGGSITIFSLLKSPSVWICIFVIMCGYTLWATTNNYIGTYCTRVLGISTSLSSTLSIIRSYIIVFVAGATGGVIVDKFPSKGMAMMTAFLLTGASAVGILLTQHVIFVCVIITVVLSYMVNVVKSTYWSIMGEAGISPAATGMATGVISFIGLTPDIFVPQVISRFITWGESTGNVASGFRLMLIWMVVWSILGITAGFFLKRKKTR